MNARIMLAIVALASLAGCAGARTTVVADEARYPVSMSRAVRDPQGDVVSADRRQIVGELEESYTAWGVLYSAVKLTPETDISDAVNEQIARAHGDAVVQLEIGTRQCALDYFVVLNWLPFWPGCTNVYVRGHIVRVAPPAPAGGVR